VSPEAWAFFTTDSAGVLSLMAAALTGRHKRENDKSELKETIMEATKPVQNGTIPSLREDVRLIKGVVLGLSDRMDTVEQRIVDKEAKDNG
jgi:hypothetical protein